MPDPYLQGLMRAHDLLRQLHDRLEREHKATPGGWFGGATRRHDEIMGGTRALLRLGEIITNEARLAARSKQST